ncbi:hypothetical protein GS436_23330 [Rhodococcus hoagii]|nr:hypothetical protein [Prescottella equi]
MLAICAAIQVLGHWYETSSGERVEGVDARRHHVPAGDALDRRGRHDTADRRPHRTTVRVREPQRGTTLGPDAKPVGRVTRGVGNGVGDGLEGVTQGSVIGTYMHGPVLARNPELADLLLKRALGVDELAPLDLPEVDLLRRERLRVR